MKGKIPQPIIGLVSKGFNKFYTRSDIESQFTYANALGDPPQGNKVEKTMQWLRRINEQVDEPLEVLGRLLEDIMEREIQEYNFMEDSVPDWVTDHYEFVSKISEELAKVGLAYSTGGHICSVSSTPTISLRKIIECGELSAVELEMNRALKQVEADPNAAVHYACNVLEATLKAYLIKNNIPFNDQNDTLNKLWMLTRKALGINPKDLDEKELMKISSGLNSIVDGTMYVRNKKSGAHGRTEVQFWTSVLRPRHARLVIHSAHTLAAYVLECLNDK